jgi:hypothetical protein
MSGENEPKSAIPRPSLEYIRSVECRDFCIFSSCTTKPLASTEDRDPILSSDSDSA